MHKYSLIPLSILLYAHSVLAEPRLSYVNDGPQLNVTDTFFAIYMGLWRGFSEEEKSLIAEGAHLMSQRQIKWQVESCKAPNTKHSDQETIWTVEALSLNENGEVLPIVEAPRAGFRYFSHLNIHGLYLRGTGAFVRPPREPGEKSTEHRARVEEERALWWKRASLKQTKGRIVVQHEMRLLNTALESTPEDPFVDFSDYKHLQTSNEHWAAFIKKTAPTQWPVYYDERAHKWHSIDKPQAWDETHSDTLVTSDMIETHIVWDWCREDLPPVIRAFAPKESLLPGGPNRAGRSNAAQTIRVEELTEDEQPE